MTWPGRPLCEVAPDTRCRLRSVARRLCGPAAPFHKATSSDAPGPTTDPQADGKPGWLGAGYYTAPSHGYARAS